MVNCKRSSHEYNRASLHSVGMPGCAVTALVQTISCRMYVYYELKTERSPTHIIYTSIASLPCEYGCDTVNDLNYVC